MKHRDVEPRYMRAQDRPHNASDEYITSLQRMMSARPNQLRQAAMNLNLEQPKRNKLLNFNAGAYGTEKHNQTEDPKLATILTTRELLGSSSVGDTEAGGRSGYKHQLDLKNEKDIGQIIKQFENPGKRLKSPRPKTGRLTRNTEPILSYR